MANSHTSDSPPQRFRRGTAASELLSQASFPLAVRGYDRRAVDEFVEQLRGLVADLEAHQTREGAVQKALDDLGEETAGILQRAHETADEITARSRAQADGRLQRAEREAQILKRDADEYAEQVITDTRLLWEERQRLIEDIRHLADVVLGTADDAMERLKLPEPLAAAEQEAEEAGAGGNVTPIPHPLSIARSDPGVPYDLETPEEDPDATEAWDVAGAGESDPDATVAWTGEADPETTAAYPVEGEDPAGPYAPAGDEDRETAAASNPDDEEPAPDEPDPGSQTVELEALPGGNTDDQATEPERKRD